MNVFKEKLNSARIQMRGPKNKTKLSVDMSTVFYLFIYCHEFSLRGSLRSPPEGTITWVLTFTDSISHIPRTCGWLPAQVFHIDSGPYKLFSQSLHCEVLFCHANISERFYRVWPGLFTGLWFFAACLLWFLLHCYLIILSVCRLPWSLAWTLTVILPCLRCVWSSWLNSACLTCILF